MEEESGMGKTENHKLNFQGTQGCVWLSMDAFMGKMREKVNTPAQLLSYIFLGKLTQGSKGTIWFSNKDSLICPIIGGTFLNY